MIINLSSLKIQMRTADGGMGTFCDGSRGKEEPLNFVISVVGGTKPAGYEANQLKELTGHQWLHHHKISNIALHYSFFSALNTLFLTHVACL